MNSLFCYRFLLDPSLYCFLRRTRFPLHCFLFSFLCLLLDLCVLRSRVASSVAPLASFSPPATTSTLHPTSSSSSAMYATALASSLLLGRGRSVFRSVGGRDGGPRGNTGKTVPEEPSYYISRGRKPRMRGGRGRKKGSFALAHKSGT